MRKGQLRAGFLHPEEIFRQTVRVVRSEWLIICGNLRGVQYVQMNWGPVDECIAAMCGLESTGIRDVRLGNRNLGPEPLKKLRDALGTAAGFLNPNLLTEEGVKKYGFPGVEYTPPKSKPKPTLEMARAEFMVVYANIFGVKYAIDGMAAVQALIGEHCGTKPAAIQQVRDGSRNLSGAKIQILREKLKQKYLFLNPDVLSARACEEFKQS